MERRAQSPKGDTVNWAPTNLAINRVDDVDWYLGSYYFDYCPLIDLSVVQ